MAESDDEQDYQNKLLRSLFANGNSSTIDSDNEEEDDENDISEHTWTCCPNTTNSTSIIYHLAFLAPGHGDSIWNSSECIAQHLLLPNYRSTVLFGTLSEKYSWPPDTCIEFGAGAALPSLVLLKEGAKKVVFTDRYVNEQTFDALRMSVDKNVKLWGMSEEEKEVNGRVVILPHTWGEDVERLTTTQHTASGGDDGNDGGCVVACKKADLLIASDCIYNPTYHNALLQSVVGAMDSNNGLFIVGYSFHGNVPPGQTLNFFEMAQNGFGLEVVHEFLKEYDGQKGIGNTNDEKRGAVYVKVLASKESVYCPKNSSD